MEMLTYLWGQVGIQNILDLVLALMGDKIITGTVLSMKE